MVSILGVKRENGDVAAEMAEHEKRITSKNAIKLSLWKTKFWKLSEVELQSQVDDIKSDIAMKK